MKPVEALKRIASRLNPVPQAGLPSTLQGELAEMLGAGEAGVPASQPLIPAVPGEAARARLLARHGHLAYINTYR